MRICWFIIIKSGITLKQHKILIGLNNLINLSLTREPMTTAICTIVCECSLISFLAGFNQLLVDFQHILSQISLLSQKKNSFTYIKMCTQLCSNRGYLFFHLLRNNSQCIEKKSCLSGTNTIKQQQIQENKYRYYNEYTADQLFFVIRSDLLLGKYHKCSVFLKLTVIP